MPASLTNSGMEVNNYKTTNLFNDPSKAYASNIDIAYTFKLTENEYTEIMHLYFVATIKKIHLRIVDSRIHSTMS